MRKSPCYAPLETPLVTISRGANRGNNKGRVPLLAGFFWIASGVCSTALADTPVVGDSTAVIVYRSSSTAELDPKVLQKSENVITKTWFLGVAASDAAISDAFRSDAAVLLSQSARLRSVWAIFPEFLAFIEPHSSGDLVNGIRASSLVKFPSLDDAIRASFLTKADQAMARWICTVAESAEKIPGVGLPEILEPWPRLKVVRAESQWFRDLSNEAELLYFRFLNTELGRAEASIIDKMGALALAARRSLSREAIAKRLVKRRSSPDPTSRVVVDFSELIPDLRLVHQPGAGTALAQLERHSGQAINLGELQWSVAKLDSFCVANPIGPLASAAPIAEQNATRTSIFLYPAQVTFPADVVLMEPASWTAVVVDGAQCRLSQDGKKVEFFGVVRPASTVGSCPVGAQERSTVQLAGSEVDNSFAEGGLILRSDADAGLTVEIPASYLATTPKKPGYFAFRPEPVRGCTKVSDLASTTIFRCGPGGAVTGAAELASRLRASLSVKIAVGNDYRNPCLAP